MKEEWGLESRGKKYNRPQRGRVRDVVVPPPLPREVVKEKPSADSVWKAEVEKLLNKTEVNTEQPEAVGEIPGEEVLQEVTEEHGAAGGTAELSLVDHEERKELARKAVRMFNEVRLLKDSITTHESGQSSPNLEIDGYGDFQNAYALLKDQLKLVEWSKNKDEEITAEVVSEIERLYGVLSEAHTRVEQAALEREIELAYEDEEAPTAQIEASTSEINQPSNQNELITGKEPDKHKVAAVEFTVKEPSIRVGKFYQMLINNNLTEVRVIAKANEANGSAFIVSHEVDGQALLRESVKADDLIEIKEKSTPSNRFGKRYSTLARTSDSNLVLGESSLAEADLGEAISSEQEMATLKSEAETTSGKKAHQIGQKYLLLIGNQPIEVTIVDVDENGLAQVTYDKDGKHFSKFFVKPEQLSEIAPQTTAELNTFVSEKLKNDEGSFINQVSEVLEENPELTEEVYNAKVLPLFKERLLSAGYTSDEIQNLFALNFQLEQKAHSNFNKETGTLKTEDVLNRARSIEVSILNKKPKQEENPPELPVNNGFSAVSQVTTPPSFIKDNRNLNKRDSVRFEKWQNKEWTPGEYLDLDEQAELSKQTDPRNIRIITENISEDEVFLKKMRGEYESLVAEADRLGRNPLTPSTLNIAIMSLDRAIRVYEERLANEGQSDNEITQMESDRLREELIELRTLICEPKAHIEGEVEATQTGTNTDENPHVETEESLATEPPTPEDTEPPRESPAEDEKSAEAFLKGEVLGKEVSLAEVALGKMFYVPRKAGGYTLCQVVDIDQTSGDVQLAGHDEAGKFTKWVHHSVLSVEEPFKDGEVKPDEQQVREAREIEEAEVVESLSTDTQIPETTKENYRPKSAERIALDEKHKEFSSAKKAYYSQEFLAQKKELAQLEAELKNPAHSDRARDEMRGRRDALFTAAEQIAYRYKEAKQPYAEALQEYLTKKETKAGTSLTPEQAKAMVGGRFFGKTKAERYTGTGVIGRDGLEKQVGLLDSELQNPIHTEMEKEALRVKRLELVDRINKIPAEHTADVSYKSYREQELALREAVLSFEQKGTFVRMKEKFDKLNPKAKIAVGGAILGASVWNVGLIPVLAGLTAGVGVRLGVKKGGYATIDALRNQGRQNKLSAFDASNLVQFESALDKGEEREKTAKKAVSGVAFVSGVAAGATAGLGARGVGVDEVFQNLVDSVTQKSGTGSGTFVPSADQAPSITQSEVPLTYEKDPIVITIEPGQSGYVELDGVVATPDASATNVAGEGAAIGGDEVVKEVPVADLQVEVSEAPARKEMTGTEPQAFEKGNIAPVEEVVKKPLEFSSAERYQTHFHTVPNPDKIDQNAPAFEKASTVSDILFERWKVGQFDHLGWVPQHGEVNETEFLQVMNEAIHTASADTLRAMMIDSGDIDVVYPGERLDMVPILYQMFPPEVSSTVSQASEAVSLSPEPEVTPTVEAAPLSSVNEELTVQSTLVPVEVDVSPNDLESVVSYANRYDSLEANQLAEIITEAKERVMENMSESDTMALSAEEINERIKTEVDVLATTELIAKTLNASGQSGEGVVEFMNVAYQDIKNFPPEKAVGIDFETAKFLFNYAQSQLDSLSQEVKSQIASPSLSNLVEALVRDGRLEVSGDQHTLVQPGSRNHVLNLRN